MYIKSKLLIFLLLFITKIAFAGTTSNIFYCGGDSKFSQNPACPGVDIPEAEVLAQRLNTIEKNAEVASTTMASVQAITEQVVAIVQGTAGALVDNSSCIYNSEFDCTQENLTHTYQTISFTTPSNHTWTVPTGITQIFITLVSGQGGQGGQKSTGHSGEFGDSGHCYKPATNGSSGNAGGQSTAFGFSSTSIGTGGSGVPSDVGSVYGAFGTQNTTTQYIDVVAGQSSNIVVGSGGTGGAGANQYYGPGCYQYYALNTGAGGTGGSVVIKY